MWSLESLQTAFRSSHSWFARRMSRFGGQSKPPGYLGSTIRGEGVRSGLDGGSRIVTRLPLFLVGIWIWRSGFDADGLVFGFTISLLVFDLSSLRWATSSEDDDDGLSCVSLGFVVESQTRVVEAAFGLFGGFERWFQFRFRCRRW